MKNNRKLKDRKEWSINGRKGKCEKKRKIKGYLCLDLRRKKNNKEIKNKYNKEEK